MKDYEVYSSLKVPKNSRIIVRLDGRSFHKLAEDLNLVKPYDEDFYKNCIESICNRLEVGVGPIPDRVYEIWSIIEEEYL